MWRLITAQDNAESSVSTDYDLAQVDPQLWRSLELLTHAARTHGSLVESLCIDFTYPGSAPPIELVPGGADKLVTSVCDAHTYTQKVAHMTLWSGVQLQIQAFRKGFSCLVPVHACRFFTPNELSARLVCGGDVQNDDHWTLSALKTAVIPSHGYTHMSKTYTHLLSVMSELTNEERVMFLAFVTGSPTLPRQGFAGLRPLLTVVRNDDSSRKLHVDTYMPSVMTCTNYLKLPDYTTKDALKHQLLKAIQEGRSAFLLS
eukprot:GDKI01044791.1.p1 GENE.GDKI01044791.1~~GDKI01044791.1.p1  ORF type:complete len:295 (-),score=69.75 GDKI01044791.1:24-800(-)